MTGDIYFGEPRGVRTLANGRRIVHLGRPAHEEAPLMLFALSGRVPTRYGFLFDDSTDDPARSPPTLYADEGVKQGEVRPAAGALAALVLLAAAATGLIVTPFALLAEWKRGAGVRPLGGIVGGRGRAVGVVH